MQETQHVLSLITKFTLSEQTFSSPDLEQNCEETRTQKLDLEWEPARTA